jgi:ketosteroid isomerase-like protein
MLGFAAYNRRDDEVALLPFDAEVEARQAEASGVTIGADLERSWRGRAGFRRMWDEWDKAWTDSRIEPKELIDLGERILVLHTFVARGRRSGADVRQPAAQLHTFRGGRVVRWEQWWSWDEALEALGLRG